MSKRATGKQESPTAADVSYSTQHVKAPRQGWQGPLKGKPVRTPWTGPLPDASPAVPEPTKRKANKTLANQPEVMPIPPSMDGQFTEHFKEAVRQQFPYMSEEELKAYMAEGQRINYESFARLEFQAKSRAQPTKPLPYSERPPGMKFEDFMRQEYRDKGLLTETFTLKSLRKIDLGLARVYYKQLARADIPDDIAIAKQRNRLNQRERSATDQRKPLAHHRSKTP